MTEQRRVQPGVPAGGQFAGTPKAEQDTELADSTSASSETNSAAAPKRTWDQQRRLMHEARNLPGGVLHPLIPGPHDPSDLDEFRQQLARHIEAGARGGSRRPGFTSWQEAWNDLTGATKHYDGVLRWYPSRCPDCHGKRFSMRTGRVCMSCMGRGRPVRPSTAACRWAKPPEPDDSDTSTSPHS